MSYLQKLTDKGLITPPPFVAGGTQYEVIMGSVAYGVSDDTSDIDVYGFCIPPKDVIFPHLAGKINGFGKKHTRFDQYQQHHIKDTIKEYDVSIYNIVRYFQLCMENNPNMVDSMFVPERCILFSTKIGDRVRASRELFLHKGCYYKFKGYAYSQMRKMDSTTKVGKRKEGIEKNGYDLKHAYHVIRLLGEVEQILIEGALDLTRDRERLKAIRAGEWELKQIKEFFYSKEKTLEELYNTSKLRHMPNEEEIKALLLSCLEEYYGSLSECIVSDTTLKTALRNIDGIIGLVRKAIY
jgi:predicted nucleotidyltransferase